MTAPRLYYSMARDGVFFARLGRVSERFGTPVSAIVLLAVWSALLAATRDVRAAADVRRVRRLDLLRSRRLERFRIAATVARCGSAVSHARLSGDARAVRRFGGGVVLNTMREQPMQAFIGLGVVLLGTPAFYLWRSRARGATPPAVLPAA